jgi:hypothetical protein
MSELRLMRMNRIKRNDAPKKPNVHARRVDKKPRHQNNKEGQKIRMTILPPRRSRKKMEEEEDQLGRKIQEQLPLMPYPHGSQSL